MHSTTIFTSLLAIASLAVSSPIRPRNTTTYSVDLTITTSSGRDWQNPTTLPITATLDQLTLLNAGQPLSASSIAFSNSTSAPASTININSVQCRAYKDAEGVVPGSAPFNSTAPALLSTNIVSVSSVLCYVVAA